MYYIPNDNEKYDEYINRILLSRENVKDNTAYQELHHIIPKCIGGTNDSKNLIWLYAQEHYYAHKLLALENPDNKGLQHAWWNMCQCSQRKQREMILTPDDFALARERFAQAMQGNSYALGQTLTQETRKKMSQARKGKNVGSKNPMYGKHCSDHCKQLLHEKLSGDKNPAARAVKCIETGQIFTTVTEASEWCGIHRSDISASVKGRQKSAGKHPISGQKLHWEYLE